MSRMGAYFMEDFEMYAELEKYRGSVGPASAAEKRWWLQSDVLVL